MSTTPASDAGSTGGVREQLLVAYETLRRSFSLSVVLIGGFLIAVATLLVEPIHPTMAGIITIWGIAGVLAGVVSYVILWLNQRYR